jgi:hypothetical protein
MQDYKRSLFRPRVITGVISAVFLCTGLILVQVGHSLKSQFNHSFSSWFFSTPYYWQTGVGDVCLIIGLILSFSLYFRKGKSPKSDT